MSVMTIVFVQHWLSKVPASFRYYLFMIEYRLARDEVEGSYI